jgi:hypothetical protein
MCRGSANTENAQSDYSALSVDALHNGVVRKNVTSLMAMPLRCAASL